MNTMFGSHTFTYTLTLSNDHITGLKNTYFVLDWFLFFPRARGGKGLSWLLTPSQALNHYEKHVIRRSYVQLLRGRLHTSSSAFFCFFLCVLCMQEIFQLWSLNQAQRRKKQSFRCTTQGGLQNGAPTERFDNLKSFDLRGKIWDPNYTLGLDFLDNDLS